MDRYKWSGVHYCLSSCVLYCQCLLMSAAVKCMWLNPHSQAKEGKSYRTHLNQMNDSQTVEIIVKSSKHMTNKKQNKKKVRNGNRRHRASAWNVHFSVQNDKKEEEGVLTQLSHFFQWKTRHHRKSLCPLPPLSLSLFSLQKVTSAFPENEVIELPCWLL